jgi:hypothetical protein
MHPWLFIQISADQFQLFKIPISWVKLCLFNWII